MDRYLQIISIFSLIIYIYLTAIFIFFSTWLLINKYMYHQLFVFSVYTSYLVTMVTLMCYVLVEKVGVA